MSLDLGACYLPDLILVSSFAGLGREEAILWSPQQAGHGQGGCGACQGPGRVPEAV